MTSDDKSSPVSILNTIPETLPRSNKNIAESGETYLETIWLIKERTLSGLVRAVDIANELNISKPSVSRALGHLKNHGLIFTEPSGAIVLTEEGQIYAQKIFYRHKILTFFLEQTLHLPSKVAEHDACRMEHVISDETLDNLIIFLKKNQNFNEDSAKNLPSAYSAVPEPLPVRGGDSLAESGETYLETIFLLRERSQSGLVRAVDIANELGFSRSSVSRALTHLKTKEFILIEPSGAIVFTPKGLNRAQKILHRHHVLTCFLKDVLNLNKEIAEHDACRIEHVISDITLEKMIDYLKQHDLLPDLSMF